MIQPEQEKTDRLAQGRQLYQLHRQYHYDQNYLLTQVEDSRLGQLKYQYDAIGRLIKTQTPNHTEIFSFDPAGNLIDPIATQMSQVKTNLVTQYQGKHYKYDAQGNVIESQEKGNQLKLSWDNLNRLVQSERNGHMTEYGYDVFGRRLYKENKEQNTLTLFGWDGDLMIWESHRSKIHNGKSYTKHYVYEQNTSVPLLQGGYSHFIDLIETPNYDEFKTKAYSINKDPVWNNDKRKTKIVLEQLAFYHCDQVGTPQTLSNERGECIWEIELNTWGKMKQVQTTHQDQILEETNIRFQGQYYDEETGLHYNRYRYYEPYSGRYISKDPIGLFGSLNTSSYVTDTNTQIDPLGLNRLSVFGSVGDQNMSAVVSKEAFEQNQRQAKARMQYLASQDRRCNSYSCWINVLEKDCPSSPPINNPNWIAYQGNPDVFHCGFKGYLENIDPTLQRPKNECFYDDSNKLVDRNHKFKGCRGTPNEYHANEWIGHTIHDRGGIVEAGREGYMESRRYFYEKQNGKNNWEDRKENLPKVIQHW